MKKLLSRRKRAYLNLILGAILVVLIPLGLATLRNPDQAGAAWYNDNWNYRKAVTVTVTTNSSDITNLQTLLTVDTTGITANLQTSCQDLRFTNANGKLLPYYIDSCSDNSATNKIWVMLDLVPKNTTTYTIYMYYGNPTAAAGSDSATFWSVKDLKGYWTLNDTSGNRTDSSASGNTLTDNATVTSATGQFSNAGQFTSANSEFLSINSNASLQTGNIDFTVATWVYLDTNNANHVLVGRYDATGDREYALYTNASGVVVWNNKGTGGEVDRSSSFGTLSTGTWYFVVAWRDYTNGTMHIQVNNGTVDSFPHVSDMVAGNAPFVLGRLTNNGNFFMNGRLDDVRFYKRVLTATERTNLYTNPGTIATTAVGTSVPSTAFATEEKAPSPVAYWKFDDATGTNANDSTTNNNDGTISGATWQTEDACISGKCLSFDGSNDVVTVSNTVSGIQTVSLWIKPITTSEQIIDINGTASISVSSGTISATSFTSPTIYVNGVVSSTLVANTWQYVTVTTGTALSGSAIKIGQISTNYGQAFIDDVKLYPYARTASQIQTDFSSRGSVKGSSTALGGNNETMKQLSNGLVGYWKMDEASGNAADSSGNGYTGTITGTTVVAGQYGNARNFNAATDKAATSNSIITGTGDFTASAWIYNTSASSINIAGNFGTGGCLTGLAGLYLTSQKLTTYIGSALTGTTTMSLNTWYHVTSTRKSGVVTLYVNGVQDATGTLADSITGNCNWTIGNGANYTTEPFIGRIDEQRVYNRALSPAEVTQLYNFAPGPVGYWKMDENTGTSAFDTSGNANTGTWNGTTTSIWKPGKFGSAGNFNGTNNFINIPSYTLTTGLSAVTGEAWINTATINPGGGEGRIINRGTNDILFQVVTGGKLAVWINNAGNSTTTSQVLNANTWYHVAFTWTTAGTITIYVNGISQPVTVGATNTSVIADSGSSNLRFGVYTGDSSTGIFTGQIDDVRIYNYSRTAKQIVEDMNAGHPAPGSPVGSAVGHWKFDEGFGTTAYNSGSGSQTLQGTLTSMASPATSTSGWTQSGKFGKGLNVDGTNDLVSVSDNTALDASSAISLTSWIYTSGTGGSYRPHFFCKGDNSGSGAYCFIIETTGFLRLWLDVGSGWVASVTGTSNFQTTYLNQWVHVAAVYDGSTAKLYINGIQEASANQTGTIRNSAGSLGLGGNTDVNSSTLNGKIDEVKIYNYALTADQIKLDMNRSQAQVMGALSDNSSYQLNAANQEYCIPGDSTSCAAPVGRWDFEEGTGTSVNDKSGNANTGTWNGTLGSQWKPGKVGGGGNFNGTNNYVQTNYSLPTTDLTISLWINETSGNAGRPFGYEDAASGTHGLGLYYPTATNPTIIMRNNGTTYDMSWGTITVGSWNHYVATISSTSGTKLYLNGVQTNSNASATAFTSAGVTLRFGSAGASAQYFTGKIDQVRIFNYVRTAAQIAWDYNKGAPVGHWKFDECQGDRANDASGNGNTGTITVGGSGTYTSLGTCAASSASTMWYNGATGKYNSSLAFDATDDQVIISPSSTIDLTNNALTLSAWVKWSGAGSSNYIIDKNSNKYSLELISGIPRFHVNSSLDATSAISSGVWHHLVGTNDGSTSRLYLDGVQINSASVTPSISSGGNLILGCYATCNSTYSFNGQIDDVRIYNYALTATQVKTLYTGGAARFGPVTGSP